MLDGRTAIVTGASKGIGRAIAIGLKDAGAKVIAVARPSPELTSLKEELGVLGEIWEGDATSDAFLQFIENLANIDFLVNNVGTNTPQPFTEVTDEVLDQMLDLNVRSTFRASRAAARHMKEGARIISITSQMGHVGSPNRTVYCMTKHAIEGLTKAMAVELAPKGIRVNTVAPTFVETPMTKPMLENPEFAAFVNQMIPLGKIATPDDIASAVTYLCMPNSGMITGHSLVVDGGWTAH